jgi:acetyltransferase-like isoleucine patch superfamily enzyme
MLVKLLKKHMAITKIKALRKEGMLVGENTLLFPNIESFGSEPYLIHIGKNCLITNGVKFITHDGAIRVINNRDEYRHINNKYGRIDIKDNVYIGENSIIMPDVVAGPYTCILPGSVVYKDIPSNCVAAGNPCRVINKLEDFEDYYRKEIYPYYERYYNRFYKHLIC